MTTFFSRQGTRPTQVIAPPRVGQFYLNLAEQKLYCLNTTARQFVREGIPISAADLSRQPLLTLDGEPVAIADLPLVRCRREGEAQESAYLLVQANSQPQTLIWSAAPIRADDDTVVGVAATLVLMAPEPDWEELAGLAHDFRTPLQAVRWLVPVLEAMPVLPAAAQVLERLRGAADRALAIGQDLLEWCRAPLQGSRRAESAWVALGPLLRSLADEHASAAQRKGISLEVDLAAADGMEALTDGNRLGRLVGNLLNNAIRYTFTGRVALRAGWREEDSTRTLVLSVEDTGTGLAEEDQESIFQPFQRGKAGKSDSDSGGSGLGLAVVDRLIHELGLTLEVFSEQGQGSRFGLLLPSAAIRSSEVVPTSPQ
jgi:signal transduction histidine kinase